MEHRLRKPVADFTTLPEAAMVQRAFDFFFVLALIAPPAALIISALLLAVRPHRLCPIHRTANAAA